MGCGWKGLKMPTDGLALAVTTGLGFSVFAGIISGVCYVLTYGLPTRRYKKPKTPWHCTVCGNQFRSIDGILEVDKVVTCTKCKRKSCKQKCSKKILQEELAWICTQCQPDSWFFSLINSLQPNTTTKGWYSVKKMDQTTIDEIDEDILEEQKKEREQVRDFIERLLGALLGGDLDNVSVKKLYNDAKYLPISGQSPCTAHANLKHLIQKFIEEAAKLPKLEKIDDGCAQIENTTDRTYEDLLSTAIINKVVENYQTIGRHSSSGSLSSRASTSSRPQCFYGEKNLQQKLQEDTSSVSSLDEWVRHSAQGSTKYFDKKSLTIRQHVGDGEISSTEDDETKEDDDDSLQPNPPPIRDNDWQENWHLRRRKLTGSLSPAPMLVPNPITSAKVLIGDQDAEDTSDLSDGASEFEDVLEPTSINAVLVNSRCVIGGRNPIESLIAKAESISDGGSTDDSDLAVEKDDIVQKFSSLESRDEVIAQVANESLVSQHDINYYDLDKEQDSEYTEKYATLPRRIVKYPEATPRQSKVSDMKSSYRSDDSKLDNADSGVTSEEDERQKSVNGDYKFTRDSKSDYQSEDSKSFSSMFEKDVSRLDSLSRLGKKKSEEMSFEKLRSEVTSRPENPEVLLDSPIKAEAQISFHAIPVMVREDFSDVESSLEPTTPTFSSEAESIERTYNLQTGKIVNSRKSDNLQGLSFVQKDFDENENVVDVKTSTPIANHMRLVEEIANENAEIYSELPLISPPGDFKSLNGHDFEIKTDLRENFEDFSLTRSNDEFSSLDENLHPVRSVLKKFSQSFPDLAKKPGNAFHRQKINFDDSENEVEVHETGTNVHSIKEKFEAVSNGKQEVYSLTARSIPKQFRQELKKEVSKDSDEIPANKSSSDENVVPFPKAKTKIEFFEKFSKH